MTTDNHRLARRGQERHRLGLVSLRPAKGWELHPAPGAPSRRDRAAEAARDVLGTWTFVAAAVGVVCLGLAMSARRQHGHGLTSVLGLVLSGLAVVELSLLLMTTRRADRIAADVALYELESDRRAAAAVADLRDEVERLRGDLARLTARLHTAARPLQGPPEEPPR